MSLSFLVQYIINQSFHNKVPVNEPTARSVVRSGMRTIILIAAIAIVAIVAVRIGAYVTNGEGILPSPDGSSATGSLLPSNSDSNETPQQAATDRLNDEQKLLQQRNKLETERQTAPYENAAEQMQEQKNMVVQDKELTKEQIRAPYEIELQRIEEEKKLLQAQQELKAMQEKMAEEEIRNTPQIQPADLRKR
jgi:hypothetical protein